MQMLNNEWLVGRNAADDGDVNIARVTTTDLVEVGTRTFYSLSVNAFGSYDRGAMLTTVCQEALMTAHAPRGILAITETSSSDSSAATGGAFGSVAIQGEARDLPDVTETTKGMLYAAWLRVKPLLDRNTVPNDDAVCLILSNLGTGKATDCIYIGRNAALAKDFANGFMIGCNADNAIAMTGTYTYGVDLSLGTFTGAPIRLKNNSPIVAKNAAGTGVVQLLKANPDDTVSVGLVQKMFVGSVTYDPPNITKGAQTTTTLTVNGVAVGDVVLPSFSVDLQGIQLTGYVSAPNTVTCVFQNLTSGNVNLGSGTLKVLALRV